MKTIVVPTDFSAISLNAVNYAADLACVIGTNLSLIHVCIVPITLTEVAAPTINMEELVTDAEEKIRELKEKINYRLGERLTVYTVVKQGDVVSEIDEYCHLVNPYAVVMGAESGGAFERFLIGGGKTITSMRKLSWPLIVVPPDVKFVSIKKIGLACDLRDVVDTIPGKEIKSLVNEFKAELHVLHVNPEGGESLGPEPVEESAWLQEILVGLNPEYHFIRGTDIEKTISDFAEQNELDLLIVIPKKHNLISKMFQHSHSKRLVLQTHVPVMAIHE